MKQPNERGWLLERRTLTENPGDYFLLVAVFPAECAAQMIEDVISFVENETIQILRDAVWEPNPEDVRHIAKAKGIKERQAQSIWGEPC